VSADPLLDRGPTPHTPGREYDLGLGEIGVGVRDLDDPRARYAENPRDLGDSDQVAGQLDGSSLAGTLRMVL